MAIGSSQWMYSAGADDFDIGYSCRFNRQHSPYLSRSFGSGGNRKTWTWSSWNKITHWEDYVGNSHSGAGGIFGSYNSGANTVDLTFTAESGKGKCKFYDYISGYRVNLSASDTQIQDLAGWYHIMLVMDTTQGTAANRAKLYINGENVVSRLTTATYPSQNQDLKINDNNTHHIGRGNGTYYAGQYMAEVHFIDGTALTPSDFGETDEDYGHWKPKEFTGSHGTKGFHLDFADSSALGNDVSGNNNDWTVHNMGAEDQMLDSPTNNFCIMNPQQGDYGGAVRSQAALTEGNLLVTTTTSDTRTSGTMAVNRDGQKYYWEVLLKNSVDAWVGIHDPELSDGARVLYQANGQKSLDGSTTTGLATYGAGDIIGVAVDEPNNQITFYKNNSSQGTLSYTFQDKQTYLPTVWRSGSGNAQWVFNFGQDSSFAGAKTAQGNGDYDFYYTPPSGFKALCTKDLPAPDVNPTEHFSVGLYSGDTSNDRDITGVGFDPDFVWLKARNYTYEQLWIDRYRGAGQRLYSHSNAAESTNTSTISAFITDGFTVGNGSGVDLSVNGSGRNYVHWNWKCNGSTTASNTSGDINCTQSVNTAAGFSISTYTGVGGDNKTIGHGLSKAPEMIVIKKRNGSGNWVVWNHMMADNYAFEGQWVGAAVSGGTPSKYVDSVTSTLVELGDAGENNQDNDTYVMYCWHSVAGYSKFGEYEGNGNADGTYVQCGFKPAFVLIKAQYGEHSTVHDTSRSVDNHAIETLITGANASEETHAYNWIDILSNGFKVRTSDYRHNKANDYLIYMAFAETPFKYATAR